MANVGTLSIKFTGDAKQLESTFTRVGVKANLFSSAIQAGLKGASTAAIDFVKASVRIASENESTLTSFKNLTGSLGAAKALYKDLLDFSSKTPFSSKEIQSGAVTLLGFGLSAKDATSAIKELGAAAAANADTDLKRLVVSFGQIQGAGVAMTKDLREFVNNGIPIYQILSETLDVSVEKINDLASSGKITADVITKAFRESAAEGGRFGDTLESQSKTLAGLTSTLKDNFAIVLGKLGDTILPVLKTAIEKANEALIQFQKLIDEGALNPFIAGLGAAVDSLGLFGDFARNNIGALLGLLKANKAITSFWTGHFKRAAQEAGEAFEEFKRPFKNVIELSGTAGQVADSYRKRLNELNVATASSGDFMEDYATSTGTVATETKKVTGSTEDLNKSVKETSESYAEFNARMAELLPNLRAFAEFQDRQVPSVPTIDTKDFTVSQSGSSAPSVDEVQAQEERLRLLQEEQDRQDKLASSLNLLASASAKFGETFAGSMLKGASASKAFAIAILSTSKDVIGALIREGVAAAITGSLKGPTGAIPVLGIALAALAGGLAQALFTSLLSSIKVPAYGDGGVVFGPTLALIGEKGPEAIVPLNGRKSRQEVVISGVQYGADTYWQNANVGLLGRMIYGQ